VVGSEMVLGDGVKLKVLHAGKADQGTSKENNESVVLKVSYGEIDFLLTGDLEKEGEMVLSEMYPDLLSSEILKVGHHGSRTSSIAPFLDRVKPEVAVISVGRRNRFRYPSQGVIKRLLTMNCQVFRTDISGCISIKTNGQRLHIKSWI
ncbi:MAG: DNA internalization-related competence protein ComEC/Rec2, partial [Candidatus Margulisbacteria bacterium]|nr:DNA internalization-related competence protein ComEC/Rec2 [Candidatus Margulisiibacteriota bacterium]